MPLIQERARTLAEVAELSQFFFVDELDYDSALLIGKNMSRELATQALAAAKQQLEPVAKFDTDSLEAVLRPLAVDLGLKTGQLFGTLRVAVTGRTAAPPLFQTMAVLGREWCLKRIEAALNRLRKL
jgi:glutamyl-tRNA synthetase